MAGNKIKIGLDSKEFEKGIEALSQTMDKNLGKSKFEFYKKEDLEAFKKASKEIAEGLRGEFSRSRELTGNLIKDLEKVKDNEGDRLEIQRKISKELTRQANLATRIGKLESSGKTFGNRGGLSGLLQKAGGVMSKTGIPGVSGLGGLLGMANPLALGGAALGGAAFAKGKQAFNVYEQGGESRQRLRGMGVQDVDVISERAQKAGLSMEDLRQRRIEMANLFGKEGATSDKAVQMEEFSKYTGTDVNQIMSAGAQLRPQLGAQGAEEATMKLMAAALESGIEGSIGPYLETAAKMLTEMNENGIAMDTEALSAMNALVGGGKGLGEEQASKIIQSFQGAVKGSSGEGNAFLQSAFAGAGLGGKSSGMLEEMIRSGGIFGISEEKAGKRLGKDSPLMAELKDAGFFEGGAKEKAGAVLGQLEKMGPGSELQQARLLQKMGFSEDMIGSGEVLRLLKELAATDDPEKQQSLQKKIEDMKGGDPVKVYGEKQVKALDNVDAALKTTSQAQLDALEGLGSKLAPIALEANKFLTNIDKTLAGAFGVNSIEEEERASDRETEAIAKGRQSLSTGKAEKIAQDEEAYNKQRSALMAEHKALREKEAQDRADGEGVWETMLGGAFDPEEAKMRKVEQNLMQLDSARSKITGENIDSSDVTALRNNIPKVKPSQSATNGEEPSTLSKLMEGLRAEIKTLASVFVDVGGKIVDTQKEGTDKIVNKKTLGNSTLPARPSKSR